MDSTDLITTALAENIRDLFASVDQTPSQFEESLATLRRDLKLAVRSSLGLTLSVHMDPDHQITLTSFDHFTDPSDIVTSLRLPMYWAELEAGSTIIFYAGVPGAFVDLAADLGYSLRLPPGAIALDEDTAALDGKSGLTGVTEWSTVDRAVGVLIDRGYTPATAVAHLKHQAGELRRDVHHAATRILASRRFSEPASLTEERSPGSRPKS